MELETLRTFFPDYIELREQGKCPFCKRPVKEEDFKNDYSELSLKEFKLSGLCLECQIEYMQG